MSGNRITAEVVDEEGIAVGWKWEMDVQFGVDWRGFGIWTR
jgi:hypothetical protein